MKPLGLAVLMRLLLAFACSCLACQGTHAQARPPEIVPLAAAPGPPPGASWVEADAALAASLGAGPMTLVATEVSAEGDRVGGFVSVPPDACLLAYARGSQGIDDLDLLAFSDDGSVLGADEDADPRPAVLVCPPHPARVYVSARVTAGRGIVAVAVHPVPVVASDRVAAALGARGLADDSSSRLDAWAELDGQVSAHRRLLGGHWEELRRVAVQVDPRAPTRVPAMIQPNRCLDAFVVAGAEFGLLDVTLYDLDGRVLTRAVPVGADRYAIVCSPIETQVSIEIRPHAGQGLCAVVLGLSPPGAEQLISGPVRIYRVAPSDELGAEQTRRAQSLRSLGYSAPLQVTRGTADVGRRASVALSLPEGCSRIEVIGGKPLAGVTADLWDASGSLVAAGEAGDGPTLFVCGKATRARLDVEALSRPGPFAIELRREKVSTPLFIAYPTAASRLLALVARSADGHLSDAERAVRVDLSPETLRTLPLDLPAGRCAEVSAAIEPGGSGLELRIFDPDKREESSLVRGRVAAASHVCALGQERQLSLELRLSAGGSHALVLARLLPEGRP